MQTDRKQAAKIKVLAAEDSPTQALQLQELLEEAGFAAIMAPNGRIALELAIEHRPDIIVSDVVMPELDGYEFCSAVRNSPGIDRTPFILVTSMSGMEDVLKGLACGADNFITKPYDGKTLLTRIGYFIANRAIRQSTNLEVSIELVLAGKRHSINSERQQILDLLISTYEEATRLVVDVDRKRLELAKANETLSILFSFSSALERSNSSDEVIQALIDHISARSDVRSVWLVLGDRNGPPRLAGSAGMDAKILEMAFQKSTSCSCRTLLEQDGLSGSNYVECDIWRESTSYSSLPRRHVCIPFEFGDGRRGILNVAAVDDRTFSQEELAFFDSSASQFAVSLARRILLENLASEVARQTAEIRKSEQMLRVRARQQAAVAELGTAALSGLTLKELSDKAAGLVAEGLSADMAGFFEWQKTSRHLLLVSGIGWKKDEIGTLVDDLNRNSAISVAFGENRSIFVPDWTAESRFEKSYAFKSYKVRTNLLVPIPGENRPYGVLGVSYLEMQNFSEENMNFLSAIANVVGVAVRRKSLNEKLLRAQKMEAIGTLTGGIAHDFNNTLMTITGNVELLKLHVGPSSQAAELADLALHGASRGSELTGQLLAFAKQQSLNPVDADINALLRNTVKLLSRTLGPLIDLQLVECLGLWVAKIDPALFESAIVNLAVNARDAMAGGGQLVIETKNTELDEDYAAQHPEVVPGRYVAVEITDSGTGIAPAIIDQIFEPFFTTKGESKGTGLGLAMVFGFINQSGGHISVYSELGLGTTFRLYLPTALERAEDQSVEAAQPNTNKSIDVLEGSETILIVDDDPVVRKTIAAQTESFGYRPILADTGAEALEIIGRHPEVALVISDLTLAGEMNGLDLAHEIEKKFPNIKFILVSGFSAEFDKRKLDNAVEFLAKPFRRAILAKKIRQLLNDRANRDADDS